MELLNGLLVGILIGLRGTFFILALLVWIVGILHKDGKYKFSYFNFSTATSLFGIFCHLLLS